MTFDEIRQAVEFRMLEWPDAPVALDNVPASTELQDAIDGKQPWVRLTINHGDSNTAGIGAAPCVRRTGLVQVQVFTPERQGSGAAAQLADSLAQHLEHYQWGKFNTLAASARRVGPDDQWFVYLVSVPFRAD